MVNIPFLGFQHVSTIPNLWFIGFRNGPSTESHHPALPVLVRNVRDAFREFDTSGDGFIGKVVILGIYIYISGWCFGNDLRDRISPLFGGCPLVICYILLLKMIIYSWFTLYKWWFPIAVLVYQRCVYIYIQPSNGKIYPYVLVTY